MIDQGQKRIILEEILKSNSFINSKLNSRLLSYLVECNILDKIPTEYSIALDVFNKGSDFNPTEDTLVRVSVYNLRKKIERYYQNMGKRDKLRVKIPKGHYEVVFFNYKKENFRDKIKNPYFYLVPVIVILAVIALYQFYLLSSRESLKQTAVQNSFANSLYSDFINSGNPKLISLGDDFIYYTDFSEFKTTSLRRMYRNSKINNEEDFEKFKSENSGNENLKKLPFSFFNQAAVWPLPYLAKLLRDFDTDYLVRSASALTSNDIKSNDIFFMGSFWTLRILEQVINDLGITYSIIGDEKLTIRGINESDSSLVYLRSGVPAFDHIDYSTFIKVPGPNQNTIFLLVSFFATGSVGTIKFLSDETRLAELKNKFESEIKSVPPYYMLVFKFSGHNREVLSTELIHVREIDPAILTWHNSLVSKTPLH